MKRSAPKKKRVSPRHTRNEEVEEVALSGIQFNTFPKEIKLMILSHLSGGKSSNINWPTQLVVRSEKLLLLKIYFFLLKVILPNFSLCPKIADPFRSKHWNFNLHLLLNTGNERGGMGGIKNNATSHFYLRYGGCCYPVYGEAYFSSSKAFTSDEIACKLIQTFPEWTSQFGLKEELQEFRWPAGNIRMPGWIDRPMSAIFARIQKLQVIRKRQ